MYKVIIVDDEPMVKEGLRESIEWDTYGLEIAGDAADGVEALELINATKPHILITDIKMPDMDGIELIKRIHENNINIKIIILSGYSDYKYLKEAIRYGVESYLLKPIDDEELTSILISTVRNIEDRIYSGIQQREGLQLLKNSTLKRLVTNTIGKKEFKEKAEFLDLKIIGNEFRICVLGFDCEETSGKFEKDDKLKTLAVLNVYEEIIIEKKLGIAFSDKLGLVVLILSNNFYSLEDETINKVMLEIQQVINEYLKISVIAGIGGCVKSVELLYKSFNEAMEGLKYARLMNENNVFYKDIDINSIRSINDIEFDFQILCRYILDNNKEEISVFINRFFNAINENTGISIESIKNLSKSFTFSIINNLSEKIGKDTYWIIEKLKFDYKLFDAIRKINELETWIKALCYNGTDLISNNVQKNTNKLVEDTLNYIKENYNQDISLKKISGKLFVNSAYLGQIFTKGTGKSFTDYINNLRIEKAKELLYKSNLKIYEISEKVGFTDAHYFLKMFKKYSGLNPSDIRKINS